jgi:hypothetical protein
MAFKSSRTRRLNSQCFMLPTLGPTLWMLFSFLYLQKNCILIKPTGKVIVESSNCVCSAWKYTDLAKDWSLSRWIQPTNLSLAVVSDVARKKFVEWKKGNCSGFLARMSFQQIQFGFKVFTSELRLVIYTSCEFSFRFCEIMSLASHWENPKSLFCIHTLHFD